MSAERLREAAALMRERAMAAIKEDDWKRGIAKLGRRTAKGQHMEGMTPALAIGVADWLDAVAARHDAILDNFAPGSRAGAVTSAENVTAWQQALAVANAYLGGAA